MKLNKFSAFANSIYPHEFEYLQSIAKFEENDRLEIFKRISINVNSNSKKVNYDASIDKRKYTSLMKWIQLKLDKIDVDVFFQWLAETDKEINLDNLSSENVGLINRYMKTVGPESYHFIRFYELLINYRDFILIRTMVKNYSLVKSYLDKYEEAYLSSKNINKELNKATVDIMEHNKPQSSGSIHWEEFLSGAAYNKKLDGYTRYKALIRLTYMYYRYYEYNKLNDVLEMFDEELKSNLFYSKRILANFYNNKAMMYSKIQNYDLAEKYGYYAIKKENTDYLLYVNNLCTVLLRNGKFTEAKKLMEGVSKEVRDNASMYNLIGYISIFIKSLSANAQYERARSFAESYLSVYSEEIFEYRWHLFFSSYLQVLLKLENYRKIISLEKKFSLVKLEGKYTKNGKYLPKLMWYYSLALFEEGKLDAVSLKNLLTESVSELRKGNFRQHKIQRLMNELSIFIPEIIKEVKADIPVLNM